MRTAPYLTAAAAATLLGTAAHADVLLNDNFGDGNRTNQSLPGSAAWYYGYQSSGAPTVVGVADGMLKIGSDTGAVNKQLFAYFTDTGSVSLANVGDKIVASLTFNVSTNVNSTDGFRFELFNSPSPRVTADQFSSSASSALGNTNWNVASLDGYGIWSNIRNNAAGGMSLRERTGTDSLLFASGAHTAQATGAGLDLGAGTATTSGMTTTPFTASITIERTSSGVDIDTDLNGSLLSFSDTSAFLTDFNMIGVFATPGTRGIGIDNVKVELFPIPEPASLVLAGLGGLLLLPRRRTA